MCLNAPRNKTARYHNVVLHKARSFLDSPLIHEMKDLVRNLKKLYIVYLSIDAGALLTKNQINVAISNAFCITRKYIRIISVKKQQSWLVELRKERLFCLPEK